MDITEYIKEYSQRNTFPQLPCKPQVVRNLLVGNNTSVPNYALIKQENYQESEYLKYNIEDSVLKHERDKGTAIKIYKDFLAFLEKKGIVVKVNFPPIDPSNTFERLMYIAKYLQNPKNKLENLYSKDGSHGSILWVSYKTVQNDLKRLRGEEDPIQVFGRVFKYDDVRHIEDASYKRSTAHPIFLTQNLTQVLIMLKGLREMAQNPFYEDWAILTASEIWQQLSDYAKKRIDFVLKLDSSYLEWLKNLPAPTTNSFHSEFEIHTGKSVVLNCLKNDQPCYIEYQDEQGIFIYENCRLIRKSFQDFTNTNIIEFDTKQGKVSLNANKIIRAAYELEGLA